MYYIPLLNLHLSSHGDVLLQPLRWQVLSRNVRLTALIDPSGRTFQIFFPYLPQELDPRDLSLPVQHVPAHYKAAPGCMAVLSKDCTLYEIWHCQQEWIPTAQAGQDFL